MREGMRLGIAKYSENQICLKRENGSILVRMIVEDTPHKRKKLQDYIDKYEARKACQ